MKLALALTAGLLAAAPAHSALVDDFNRADGPAGANYTASDNGGISILNNQAVAGNGSSVAFVVLSTYNGSSSSTAGIDIALRGQDAGSYVALSLGFGTSNSYFIKVQDNDGNGTFDTYGFYSDNNNGTGPFRSLSSSFQTGSFEISYTGTIATLLINANGGMQSYSHDYGYAPGSNLVGLGINRHGVADNLRFEQVTGGPGGVPEPSTWAMLILGFGAIGGAVRARRAKPALA